jgi:hypothetical protein
LPIGGVYLSFRFTKDSAEFYKSKNGSAAPEQGPQGALEGDKDSKDINGRSGKFKAGGQDEVFEYAAMAVEAQNRAIKQRQMIAKSAKQLFEERMVHSHNPDATVWRTSNGYRDWKNLDSVFITMGPNYVAQSNEVGANICKVYTEDTSVFKELTQKASPLGLGKPQSLDEEATMLALLSTIYKGENPLEIKSTLRPLICKDVNSIQREGLTDAQLKPTLRVKVHSAMNLRTTGSFLNGKVEPKVIIEIPGRPASKWTSFFGGGKQDGKFETDPAQDGKHVVWNQEGIITGYNYGDDLKITVVDKEWIGFESHLGEARLPGADFYPESWFAELPLANAGEKGNADGAKRPRLLLEVKVVEPLGKADMWPPIPAQYAPVSNLNESDQETQRLANWDVHQCAKLAFSDVNPNYQKNEDIWGALETAKGIEQGAGDRHDSLADRIDRPHRVKDECLMA